MFIDHKPIELSGIHLMSELILTIHSGEAKPMKQTTIERVVEAKPNLSAIESAIFFRSTKLFEKTRQTISNFGSDYHFPLCNAV